MPNLKKKCNTCKHNYKANGDEPRCNRMCENFDEYEPMTNFEKIKAMSVEEMAEFLNYSVYEDEDYHTVIDKKVFIGLDDVIDWLESEVVE